MGKTNKENHSRVASSSSVKKTSSIPVPQPPKRARKNLFVEPLTRSSSFASVSETETFPEDNIALRENGPSNSQPTCDRATAVVRSNTQPRTGSMNLGSRIPISTHQGSSMAHVNGSQESSSLFESPGSPDLFSQNSLSFGSSQSVLAEVDVNESGLIPPKKRGNRTGKRGSYLFEETFKRPKFRLKQPYADYWTYMGHNKDIEQDLLEEIMKTEHSRPSSIRGGVLVKCLRCSYVGRTVDGQWSRLEPHMQMHGFEVSTIQSGKGNRKRKVVEIRKYLRNEPPQIRFNRHMLEFLVESGIPFNAIKCASFSKMISSLEFRVNVLTPQSYYNHLKRICATEVVPYVYSLLQKAEYIGLVIDSWTNRKNQAIFCIQAVFMDNDCNIVQKTIDAIYMNKKHKGEYIRDLIMAAIRKYDIQKKVTYIISDKGSNMIKAIDLVGSWAYQEFHRDYEWAHCFPHGVHNVMIKSLRLAIGCQRLINEVVKQIQFICKGQDTARELKRLTNRSFVRPVRTRWSSYHKMLERFLEEKMLEATKSILEDRQKAFDRKEHKRKVPKPLSDYEIEVLKELLLLMGPVAVATDLLQGDTLKATAAIVTIIQCHTNILSLSPKTTEGQSFQRSLSKYLKDDFRDSLNPKGLIMLTALNPLWMPEFFGVYHERFTTDPYQLPEEATVSRMIKNLITEFEHAAEPAQRLPSENDFCDDLLNQLLKKDKDNNVARSSEVDRFVKGSYRSFVDKSNVNFIRDFWIAKQKEYPILFNLFKKHFIRRVSTASVERAFSKLTKLSDKYRPFKISTLSELLMVSENLFLLGENEDELARLHEVARSISRGSCYDDIGSDLDEQRANENSSCANEVLETIVLHEQTGNTDERLYEVGDFDCPSFLTGSDALAEILEFPELFDQEMYL